MKFYFYNDFFISKDPNNSHPERYFIKLWEEGSVVFINRKFLLANSHYEDENCEFKYLPDVYLDEISDDIKCEMFIRDVDDWHDSLPAKSKWKTVTKYDGQVYEIRKNIFGIADKRYKFDSDIFYVINEDDKDTIELAKHETDIEHRFAIGDCSENNINDLKETFLSKNAYFTKKDEAIHFNLARSELWVNTIAIDKDSNKPMFFGVYEMRWL